MKEKWIRENSIIPNQSMHEIRILIIRNDRSEPVAYVHQAEICHANLKLNKQEETQLFQMTNNQPSSSERFCIIISIAPD